MVAEPRTLVREADGHRGDQTPDARPLRRVTSSTTGFPGPSPARLAGAWSVGTTVMAFAGGEASAGAVVVEVMAAGAGVVAPGGGYTQVVRRTPIGRLAVSHADEAIALLRKHADPLMRAAADGVQRAKAVIGGGQCFVADTEVRTADGVKRIQEVSAGDLVLARAVEATEGEWFALDPDGAAVWVLGAGEQARASLRPGAQVVLGDRVYTPLWVGDSLYVQWTGDVIARVTATFSRAAPAVVDAELAYADGRVDELTGTPNHPFWVPALGDYAPLGDLEVGTVLHMQGGGEAILVSKTWRQGDFEVFDFEVEGLHNFYVRGEGSDAAGVLVHNSTAKQLRPSGCPSCPCFVPGTMVLMADGSTKPIEDVEAGEHVWAANPLNDREAGGASSTVVHVMKNFTERVITVEIAGSDGPATIEATGEHPFWVVGIGWVAADALAPGDHLLDSNGVPVDVLRVKQERRESETYNLTVADVHTYFVVAGGQSVLVHNRDIDLGDGYTGRVDAFETKGQSSFEVHVYDSKGKEVGVHGPADWIPKHGHSGDAPDLPENVQNRLNGRLVQENRARGWLPEKGKADITGGKWKDMVRNACP